MAFFPECMLSVLYCCRASLPPKKAAAAAASAAAEAQAAADAAAAAVAYGADDMGNHDLDDREDTPSSGKDEVLCLFIIENLTEQLMVEHCAFLRCSSWCISDLACVSRWSEVSSSCLERAMSSLPASVSG